MKHLDAITKLNKLQDTSNRPPRERAQTNKKRPIIRISDFSDNIDYSAKQESNIHCIDGEDLKQLSSKENVTRLSLYSQNGPADNQGCHGSRKRSSIGVPWSGGRLSLTQDKTLLSPSSSLFSYNMYHPHQIPSTSTSTSSSYTSRMMLLDQQTQLSPPITPRDSVFIKQLHRKRRESVGEVVNQHRKRPTSSIKPRLTQSTILQTSKRNKKHYSVQPINDFLDHEASPPPAVHWDPHIDAFEILRAKITGITRSMQEFHVQELFHDEMRSCLPTTTTSSPLTTSHHASHPIRRLSLANLNDNNSLSLGHRRIKSTENNKQLNDSDEEDSGRLMTSPNLTALFLTTNNLINSRLDELCDTASIKSSSDSDWQKQFLSLVTRCIHQSEALESLSTDVLNTEHRVRELMLINDTLHEQFHEREKQYEDRIRQCQEVAQQQLMMIDSLEELTADINMKMESRTREMYRQQALMALDLQCQSKQELFEEERWNFQQSVADLLKMDDKHDVIQKMRWEIGMFVGGGVGTGHVIHSFDNKLNGIDMMIAGTGTTTATNVQSDVYIEDEEDYHELEQVKCLFLLSFFLFFYIIILILKKKRLFQYHRLFAILNYTNISISFI
jgi:hypothetical protein